MRRVRCLRISARQTADHTCRASMQGFKREGRNTRVSRHWPKPHENEHYWSRKQEQLIPIVPITLIRTWHHEVSVASRPKCAARDWARVLWHGQSWQEGSHSWCCRWYRPASESAYEGERNVTEDAINTFRWECFFLKLVLTDTALSDLKQGPLNHIGSHNSLDITFNPVLYK